jgi:hypothetical protein
MKKLLLLALLLFPVSAHAATLADFLPSGKKAWSAYQCAELAGLTGDAEQATRLLAIGNAEGKKFVEGTREMKLTPDDVKGDIVGFKLISIPPASTDFMLGRMYERAATANLVAIYQKENDMTKAVETAREQFKSLSCAKVQ